MRCGFPAGGGGAGGAPPLGPNAGAAIVLALNAVADFRNERREPQPHRTSQQAPLAGSAWRSTGSHLIVVSPLASFCKERSKPATLAAVKARIASAVRQRAGRNN